ncbi:DUF368 domain-containing protein [Halobacillus litoralis]|uniref:DUF368 domain-containing protein n=1 Tax=Halobacillus litoralis TaxID=45668 RepID=UPI001CD4C569|nr:DUF368 domain-containing protein [Halobacillus litoralis]MCA0972605.1 DUF368 domain-containing protein [Halobacillus litoralis]
MWEWRNIYRGMLMGASDIVPGVSGGTIAVVLGIYDRLIEAINGLFSKEWKEHLKFLIPLGLGVGTAILLLANLINFLFDNYPEPTQYFFLGLIIGVLPYLTHKADMKHNFHGKHYGILILGAIIVGSMAFFQTAETDPIENFSASTYVLLFFSGFIASSAMILPGISGSFILYLIGIYSTVTTGIEEFNFTIIGVVGVGIVLGIISMSKIVKYFLENHTSGTFALIIGLVIGSVFVVFPGIPEMQTLIVSVVTFLGGLLAAWLLGRVEYK